MRKYVSIFTGIALIAPSIALAQSTALDRAGSIAKNGGISVTTDIPGLIGNIISSLLALLGVVMVVLIVYAGFLYLTAAGDDDKVTHAKKILIQATIGFALTMSAYAITYFVVNELTRVHPDPTGAGLIPPG